MIECSIKVKHNFKKINTISQKLPEIAKEVTEDILENIKGLAIRLEYGHNSKGILCELVDMSTNEVKGRVYARPEDFMSADTDGKETCYLWFEYFGTGSFAEMGHIGVTKHFKETGYTEWYIPVNKVARTLNFPTKVIAGKEFYVATGAKANHFMSDAEFESRQKNTENARKKFEAMLKEVCK